MAKKMKSTLTESDVSTLNGGGIGKATDPAIGDEHESMDESDRAVEDARERIAARAYELYVQRGGDHGRDTDDWLAAEREVSRPFDRPTDD